jgi:DNA-binding NarL/FixJ family response regulator
MVTVALADDHVVVRQGLRLLVESDPEFTVVGEAADGIEALELVKRLKPMVLIVDLMMPGLDGLETTRRISRMKLDTRVVVLTMYGDEAYLLDAIGSGAAGYVVKESCGADLFQALRDVVAGRRYLSPLLSEAHTRGYLQKFRTILLKLAPTLTTRERKVLQLVLEGVSNCDIGARLKISLRTVESHLANFVAMLGIKPGYVFMPSAVQRRVAPKGPRKRREKNNTPGM